MRRFLATAILVSALTALALVVFPPSVAMAGGGCHGGSEAAVPPGDDAVSTVKIDGCMFFPTVARVPAGTTVTFLNTGQVPHNVTGVDWASPEMSTGARFEHTFTGAGVYPFACTLHAGMNGAVVVGGDAGDDVAAAAPVTTGDGDEPPGSDPLPFALAAVGGLVLGTLLGAAAALAIARPRSTTRPVQTSPAD